MRVKYQVSSVEDTLFSRGIMHIIQILVSLVLVASTSSGHVPYSEYILAPASRTVYPAAVHKVNGTVTGAESLIGASPGSALFDGVSSVTFDYSKNIAGVVSVTVGSSSSSDALIGLTYTESSLWINGQASDATADAGLVRRASRNCTFLREI